MRPATVPEPCRNSLSFAAASSCPCVGLLGCFPLNLAAKHHATTRVATIILLGFVAAAISTLIAIPALVGVVGLSAVIVLELGFALAVGLHQGQRGTDHTIAYGVLHFGQAGGAK